MNTYAFGSVHANYKYRPTTALRPTPGDTATLLGKIFGGAAYAERYRDDIPADTTVRHVE
jgi:hypothetical protein